MDDTTQPTDQTMDRGGHTGLLAAVWLAPDVAAQLALPGGEPADQLHITLAYCGDASALGDVATARLILAMQAVAQRSGPLTGRVGGYGRFYASESSDGKDVLYANVDVPGLDDLRDAVCDACETCGMSPSEKHGYTPHITLSYIDAGAPLPAVAVPETPLRIDAVTLAIGDRRVTLPLMGAVGATADNDAPAMPAYDMSEAVRVIEATDKSGREWDVLLITAGISQNGRYYAADMLRKAAPLFEGCPAYADHQRPGAETNTVGRSVRDIVGRFSDVRFGSFEVDGRTVEALHARLRVVAPWLQETLREAISMGMYDLMGLSINAKGVVTREEHDGRMVEAVKQIISVGSVDLVSEPSAGGRLVRLVASADAERDSMASETATETTERWTMDEATKTAIAEATAAALSAALPGLVAQITEAVKPAPVVETKTETVTETKHDTTTDEARTILDAAQRETATSRVERALAGATGLSEVGKQFVKRGLLARRVAELTEAAITEAVQGQMDYEAALKPAQATNVSYAARGMTDPADKKYKALQGWFQGSAVDGVTPFRTLQEAYCQWQGINYFDMDIRDFQSDMAAKYNSRKGHGALLESIARASWGEVFADNLYVMMIKEYNTASYYDDWRKIVSDIEPVPDFQTRHWARVGGYGDLSSVAETITYPLLTSPTDEEVTYSITKYGGLDDVTMEALTDPRGAAKVRRIPQNMARAAKRTLYRDVLDLVTTDNTTMSYDSVALYHSGHGNTGTTALSVSGLYTTETAMRDQTPYNESSEILGARNAPKVLIVPNELRARAMRIANPSDAYTYGLNTTGNTDADTSIDPQQYKGRGLEVITYDYLTDATDWWAVADPAQVPTVVVGFLNGQQEPELFVQDDPNVGTMFNSDKLTYKCRTIYGFQILDHRSFYRQVV